MEWREELTLDQRLWVRTLGLGEVSGCRPKLNIRGYLDALAEREGYIPDENWVAYLWGRVEEVDEEYARCLSGALSSAVEQWRDPSLGLRHRVNGAECPTFSKGGISEREVNAWERIARFAAEGAFSVGGGWSEIILRRR